MKCLFSLYDVYLQPYLDPHHHLRSFVVTYFPQTLITVAVSVLLWDVLRLDSGLLQVLDLPEVLLGPAVGSVVERI